jgi:recombinational DNA repair protein (RecF pathway)
MAYKTYITEALVCGSRTQNTSDKSYLLFTREAGMLYAAAKSVREERSKQRFALQEFSQFRATLVHGKAGWRITGAEPIMNLYSLQSTREARTLIRNIIRTLRRLLHGEVAHPAIFDETIELLTLPQAELFVEREEVLTIRILHSLGYIGTESAVEKIVSAPTLLESLQFAPLSEVSERKKIIEEALHATQL